MYRSVESYQEKWKGHFSQLKYFLSIQHSARKTDEWFQFFNLALKRVANLETITIIPIIFAIK